MFYWEKQYHKSYFKIKRKEDDRMANSYQVQLRVIRDGGNVTDIFPKNTALDVLIGQIQSSTNLQLPGSSKNETLDVTISNIRKYLSNLENVANIHRNVSSDISDSSEINLANSKAVNSVNIRVDEISEKVANTEASLSGKAPTNHAAISNIYGVGTANQYGHVRITDTYTSNLHSDHAASQTGLYGLYDYTKTNKADKNHVFSKRDYGVGNGNQYGHLKITNSTENSTFIDQDGRQNGDEVAVSYTGISKMKRNITNILDDCIRSSDFNHHKSSHSTSLIYGHVKLSHDYRVVTHIEEGIAASDRSVNNLYSALISSGMNGATVVRPYSSTHAHVSGVEHPSYGLNGVYRPILTGEYDQIGDGTEHDVPYLYDWLDALTVEHKYNRYAGIERVHINIGKGYQRNGYRPTLRIYGANGKSVELLGPNNPSDNYEIELPNKRGTIALLSDITSSGYVTEATIDRMLNSYVSVTESQNLPYVKTDRLYGLNTLSSTGFGVVEQSNVPTLAFLSYWDGSYTHDAYGNGPSNLRYCCKGLFGSMATQETTSYYTAEQLNGFFATRDTAINTHTHAWMYRTDTTIGRIQLGITSNGNFVPLDRVNDSVDIGTPYNAWRTINCYSGFNVYNEWDAVNNHWKGIAASIDGEGNAKFRDLTLTNGCIKGSVHFYDFVTMDKTLTVVDTKYKSDKREKHDINSINMEIEKYNKFFGSLNPVSYIYNNDKDNKVNIGFIAQEVIELLKECDLYEKDLSIIGTYCPDKTDPKKIRYSINYNNFIGIITMVLQNYMKTTDERLINVEKALNL